MTPEEQQLVAALFSEISERVVQLATVPDGTLYALTDSGKIYRCFKPSKVAPAWEQIPGPMPATQQAHAEETEAEDGAQTPVLPQSNED
jgi:hypothetical protein